MPNEREPSADTLAKVGTANLENIERLIEFHNTNRALKPGLGFVTSLIEDEGLQNIVHSFRLRIKSETSLRGKLIEKAEKAIDNKEAFDIDASNFYRIINDTIGARLIYLSLTEFPCLHASLIDLFRANSVELIDEPVAYTFDNEVESFFKEHNILVKRNPRLYTSVHYIIAPNTSQPGWSAEIQVRTIAEELWGEVDHKFNYPRPHPSFACGEQIRALAKLSGAALRLTDSIFRSAQAWEADRERASVAPDTTQQ